MLKCLKIFLTRITVEALLQLEMNERKQQNEKERTFLSGCKARITLFPLNGISQLSTSWWINFILRKKNSYSGYCRVRSDGGSLIALGHKIPDVSYIVAKLTTFCLGRSPQMIQYCERNEHLSDEWHIHELRNSDLAGFEHISEWNKTSFYWNYFVFSFLVSERILYIFIFSRTKRCLASEDT